MSQRAAHIAIIGAGPAGCSAACHLSAAGARVTLIESKTFPRVKVCGEYVSPAGTGDLEALLDCDRLRAVGARRVDRFAIVRRARGRDRRVSWDAPAAAWTLSRGTLDAALVTRAIELGVRVLQPVAVREVRYGDKGVEIELSNAEDAGDRRIVASLAVHADGSGRHDPAGPIPVAHGLVGLKCHARLASGECGEDAVEMRAGEGMYVGSVRVESDLCTVALCAKTSLVRKHGGDHDAMVSRCLPSWSASWRTSAWIGSPVARSRYVVPGNVRSFRVGNAAGAVDPVGGEGIASALWSGRVLAKLLTGCDDTEAALRYVHERFARAYAARLRTRLPACRFAAELLMRPRVLAAVWPMLHVPGLSIGPWYSLTGKPSLARVMELGTGR